MPKKKNETFDNKQLPTISEHLENKLIENNGGDGFFAGQTMTLVISYSPTKSPGYLTESRSPHPWIGSLS